MFKALMHSYNSSVDNGLKVAAIMQIRSFTFKKASLEGYLRLKANKKTSDKVNGIIPKLVDLTCSFPSLKKFKTRSMNKKFPREAWMT